MHNLSVGCHDNLIIIFYVPQSLAMYVPPDEAMKEQGEVNLTYKADGSNSPDDYSVDVSRSSSGRQSQSSTGAPSENASYEPVASINPIYQRFV